MDPIRAIDPTWQATVMVCCNQRPGGAEKASCGRERGAELRAWLKARSREEGLKGRVLVAETSCLGVCSPAGVMVVAMSTRAGRRGWVVPPDADREAVWQEIRSVVTAEKPL